MVDNPNDWEQTLIIAAAMRVAGDYLGGHEKLDDDAIRAAMDTEEVDDRWLAQVTRLVNVFTAFGQIIQKSART